MSTISTQSIPEVIVDPSAVAEGLIDSANTCSREQAALRTRFNIAAHTIKRLVRELSGMQIEFAEVKKQLAEAKRELAEAEKGYVDDIPAFLRKQAE